jgi:hypothetical protein
MLATEDRLPVLPVLDRGKPTTQTAANSTGKDITAQSPTTGEEASVRCIELSLRDKRIVLPREPLAVEQNLAQVDPRQKDLPDRGVLDAGAVFDPLVTEPFGAQSEDFPDDHRLVVGHGRGAAERVRARRGAGRAVGRPLRGVPAAA